MGEEEREGREEEDEEAEAGGRGVGGRHGGGGGIAGGRWSPAKGLEGITAVVGVIGFGSGRARRWNGSEFRQGPKLRGGVGGCAFGWTWLAGSRWRLGVGETGRWVGRLLSFVLGIFYFVIISTLLNWI